MRLAFLGTHALFPDVARAAAHSSEYIVAAVVDAGASTAALRSLCPAARCELAWESLLEQGAADVVLFARGEDSDRSEEQLRRLAQTGMPLLVLHPACDVMAAYEIEVIRRDTGGAVVPYLGDWSHPAWEQLRRTLAAAGRAGAAIDQVRWERFVADRSRAEVLAQFSRDEVFLRRLVGPLASVHAVGGPDATTACAQLSVFCTTSTAATANWSLVTPGSERFSKLTIACAGGTVTLTMPDQDIPWSLRRDGLPGGDETFDPRPAVLGIFDQLRRLLPAGGPASAGSLTPAGTGVPSPPAPHPGLPDGWSWPDWNDACLSLEAVDSVERSLRRKRAVDLHLGERTEESAFKGSMAAAGCLILCVVLAGFLVLAVVEGFRMPLQDTAAPPTAGAPAGVSWPLWARLWPVYPLLAFLLLQLLLRVARPSSAAGQSPGSSGTPTRPG